MSLKIFVVYPLSRLPANGSQYDTGTRCAQPVVVSAADHIEAAREAFEVISPVDKANWKRPVGYHVWRIPSGEEFREDIGPYQFDPDVLENALTHMLVHGKVILL